MKKRLARNLSRWLFNVNDDIAYISESHAVSSWDVSDGKIRRRIYTYPNCLGIEVSLDDLSRSPFKNLA